MSTFSSALGRVRLASALVATLFVWQYGFFGNGALARNGPTPDDFARDVAGVLLVLWWAGPAILYAFAIRSRVATMIGFLVVAATIWMIYVLSGSQSSTIGIGVFLEPTRLWLVVGVLIIVEKAVLSKDGGPKPNPERS